ncbi:hypothetical protein AEAC466_17335 [Asticcacaulis sp. AC466]|uniref:phage portal protein n=1 Tax=Asticcacaulis sp. AC466 TaxID=1282362 RepID=UPI0003C4084E|nr:phage portal protein [Asticcacaulis sp. AC466]ESQ82386.1 hypothetical protein AEAC466_17335 [Asticcacaulis sp. AC466]
MRFGDFIDRCIEPFAPLTALRRTQQRKALELAREFAAAGSSRRTKGWKRTGGAPNREIRAGLTKLRGASSDLIRNNKYAATMKRKIVAWMIGDGITVQLNHPDAEFQKQAQDMLDAHFKTRLDGFSDMYGLQKLAVLSTFERGDSILVWSSRGRQPNSRCQVFEGDLIDQGKNEDTASGGKIVMGKEFDRDGDPVALWLFDEHPGDGGWKGKSKRYDIADIDHVFEQTYAGQARGVPWLGTVALDLKDEADLEETIGIKKKIEACLALILRPGANSTATPFDTLEKPERGGPPIDSVRPGMIYRTEPGDEATTLAPSSTGDGVEFMKFKLAGIAAGFMPYFMLTGDMSQSSYISLRAALNDFYKQLDDWQQNMCIPQFVAPAADRALKLFWLKTGDKRFLELTKNYGVPRRPALDPISDIQGEREEIRTGFKTQTRSLAERGLTFEQWLDERVRELNALDAVGLVVDSDPRKVTNAGMLQQPQGYILPKNTPQN